MKFNALRQGKDDFGIAAPFAKPLKSARELCKFCERQSKLQPISMLLSHSWQKIPPNCNHFLHAFLLFFVLNSRAWCNLKIKVIECELYLELYHVFAFCYTKNLLCSMYVTELPN